MNQTENVPISTDIEEVYSTVSFHSPEEMGNYFALGAKPISGVIYGMLCIGVDDQSSGATVAAFRLVPIGQARPSEVIRAPNGHLVLPQ